MAKRRNEQEEAQRQSRKEVLLARRRERHTRQVRLAVAGIVGLLLIVLVIAIVSEYAIKPGQPVALVNGEEITTAEFQDRVRFQRAQLILGIEDLSETFGGDVGLVQQYAGQQMQLLVGDPVSLGQFVLDDLIDETLIRQAAESRGITVGDDEVQEAIEESFNFFDGGLPTPVPTATETVVPTPSLTPIPTAVITEVLPTNTPFPTATLGPTTTPFPTSTPVSATAFAEDYDDMIRRYRALGVSEETYRSAIRGQLYQEKFLDALAVEEEMAEEEEHASAYIISFDTEDEAAEALEQIEAGDFLSVWNAIRSTPADPEAEEPRTASAREILWRTRDNYEATVGESVAAAVFELELETTGDIIVEEGATEEEADQYYLVQVTGREVRPLGEGALQNKKQELLTTFVEGQRTSGVETFERWRLRVPQRPELDPSFLEAPTPAPTIEIPPTFPVTVQPATEEAAEPEPTPTVDDGT
jgi:hypothetical protein